MTLVRFLFVLAVFLIPVFSSQAQGLSFALTPTIFDMAAVPGQAWNTNLKVINNNAFALTVYATPVNFRPRGEFGHGEFIPRGDTDVAGTTLAEWMTVAAAPVTVPAESSITIPVSISVPVDASPGGHYAAVMVGTRPPAADSATTVKTSQIITSLFFVRIAGDVIERGDVRTFSAASWIVTLPQMSFSVRFENKGNVHLQPRGEIVVQNMWGKERGIIPMNSETNFGNVLPESIRQFDVTWEGEASLLDIGRYTATLTLGYGSAEQKFTTRQTAFWVVPLKPVLGFLIILFGGVWFVTRSVRMYVRHMLRLSGIDPRVPVNGTHRPRPLLREGDVRIERVSVQAPVMAGVRDLRSRLAVVRSWLSVPSVIIGFVRSYPRFFISFIGILLLLSALGWYLVEVRTPQRDYVVTVDAGDQAKTISSEEIIHDRATENNASSAPLIPSSASSTDQSFSLHIINASKTPGLGGQVADRLAAVSYRIDALTADLEGARPTSVIVYPPELETVALALSETLGGLLLSAFSDTEAKVPTITVYLGIDYVLPKEVLY